ncbi:sushi, von Willebrand factor type A, EGF and pentraxin domain-containing protein 1-like [Dermacentor andersoni]|uniref:sushi, von Willebrand factor type A, EGF and pentraxin domain-containing protein 1-like n=1 Tax=Dermacentor andersoni TaxID=34620 RepID=UPI002415FC2C|nr:sushi, von Willebrand factor type A, EGF and pentraxin domain-containing protein 1-like [Dermacentor andersoni]
MRLTLFVAVAAGFCIGSARFLEDENNEQNEQMCTEPEDMYIHHRVHQENEYREKFPVGTRLTYRCGSGYIPRDIKTWNATCQVKDDGSVGWYIGKHDCRPVSCGHPGDVPGGRLLDAVFLFPRQVRYQCNKGYRMVGEANLYCQSDGTWNRAKPECHIVDCGPLDGMANGAVRLLGTQYGSKAEFTCNEGFKLTGTNTRTCEADGQWSDESPRCEEIWCPAPDPPEGNGSTSLGPNPGTQRSGIRLRYFCPEKTVLQGSDINVCRETGSWLFDRPTCTRNCVVQADPSAAVLRRPDNWSNRMEEVMPGAEVTVSDSNLHVVCREGYEFVDTKMRHDPQLHSLRCRDGAWYPPSPWCREKPCRNLHVPGGEPEFLEVSHNEMVNFTCKKNYQLQRVPNRSYPVCRFGKVDGPLPTCKPVGCRFEDLLNRVKGGNPRPHQDVSHGSLAVYECETPFVLEDGGDLRCYFGTWTGQPPKCVARRQCIVPYNSDSTVLQGWWLTRGRIQSELNPGTSVRNGDSYLNVKCKTGYHFRDESLRGRSQTKLYCNGGQWSPTAPWCTKIHPNEAPRDCKFPYRVNRFQAHNDHVRILAGNSVPHGTKLIFHCEPVGEVLLRGSSISQCHDGQWIPEVPYCYGTESRLWNGISMRFLTENYTVPGGVVYLEPNSDVVLDCWSREPVEIRLNTIEKAHIDRTCLQGGCTARAKFRLRYNERAIVTCEKSYERTSSWSIPVRGHHLYRCPDIPSAPYRVWKKNSRGHAVQFDCENGYIRQGKSTVHCLGQGIWSDPFPTCELPTETSSVRSIAYKEADTAKQMESAPAVPAVPGVTVCPPIPTVRHLEKREVMSGSYELYCQEGYRLQGKSLVRCLANGTWSDDFPTCVPRTEPLSAPAAMSEDDDTAKKTEATTPAAKENQVAKCTLPTSLTGKFHRKDEKGNYLKIDQDKTFDHEAVVYIFCDKGNQYEWWQCHLGEWSHEQVCKGSYQLAPDGTTHDRQQGTASKPGGYVAVKPAQHSHTSTTSEAPHLRPSDDYNDNRAAAVHDVSSSHQFTGGHRRNVNVSAESVPKLQQKGETSRRGPALISRNEPSRSGTCTHPTASGYCSDPGDRGGPTLKGIGVGSVDTAAGVAHELRPTGPNSRKESAIDAYSNANSNFGTSYSKQSPDFPRQEEKPKLPPQFDVFSSATDRTIINSSADVAAETPRPEGSSESSSIAAPNGCQLEQFYTFAPFGLAIVINDGASMVPSNSTFWAFCDGDGYTLVGNSSAVTCLQTGSWSIPPQLTCIEGCVDFDTGPKGPTVMERKDAYELGDSITLSCAPGTQLQPHVERITCLGRSWSEPAVPICVPVKEKREPKNQAEKKRRRSG